MNFLILMLNRLQLAALDIIWLELNAELELDLYIINHGDQVFIPGLTFPKHPNRLSPYPTKLRLKKNLVYIPIELTKESNIRSSSSCNGTAGYTYGRTYSTSWAIPTMGTLNINILWQVFSLLQMFQSISDCIKDQLRTFLTDTKNELFTGCSTPWLGNITNEVIKNYESQEPCNISTATEQSVEVMDFFMKSASYFFPECQRMYYFKTFQISFNHDKS